MLSAEFLEANYDNVFDQYQKLLNSENYVTRRQSLKLLGELLLDRHNYSVMTKYISSPGILQRNRNHSIVIYSRSLKYSRKYNNEIFLVDNLKLMMNLLKERARNIQFEAFHVFKVHWICFRFNLLPLYLYFFYISRNSWLFIFMYKCFPF